MAEHSQLELEQQKKTLEDFFVIRNGVLNLIGTLQTASFIPGVSGVQIRSEGLNAGTAVIAGATSDSTTTTIPGALTHTGNTAGLYNVTPVARQSVTALSVSVGTADGTVADVGSSFNQTTLNNNFRDLADKINQIRTALVNIGILS